MPNVLLFELNEVNWPVLEPYLKRGELPHLQRIIESGACGTTICRDQRLDPCVGWPTLHTGTSQETHRIEFLGQHPDTFGAPQIWDLAIEAGRRVGVFGSLLSWPPRPSAAFYIPECFARDAATLPETAGIVQRFNIKYSTENKKAVVAKTRWNEMMSFTYGLLRNGVKPATLLGVAREVLAESINPKLKWRRACLQPIINYDVFERLYKRSQPHFATFFTNHVAYYLHRYWRACFPNQFQEIQDAEVENYGQTIPYSLRVSDDLIGRTLSLIGDDTVLVVASALGQGPVKNPANASQQNVLRSLDRLVKILGYDEMVRISGSMTHEHVLVCDDSNVRDQIVQRISEIRLARVTGERLFKVLVRNDTVCVSFTGQYEDLSCGILIPSIPRAMSPEALHIERYDVQPDTGDHTPDGIFIAAGSGISKGFSIGEFDLRDVAPTILHLLDIKKPEQMKGRVLNEVFQ